MGQAYEVVHGVGMAARNDEDVWGWVICHVHGLSGAQTQPCFCPQCSGLDMTSDELAHASTNECMKVHNQNGMVSDGLHVAAMQKSVGLTEEKTEYHALTYGMYVAVG